MQGSSNQYSEKRTGRSLFDLANFADRPSEILRELTLLWQTIDDGRNTFHLSNRGKGVFLEPTRSIGALPKMRVGAANQTD